MLAKRCTDIGFFKMVALASQWAADLKKVESNVILVANGLQLRGGSD
jgi:hypothetical protein